MPVPLASSPLASSALPISLPAATTPASTPAPEPAPSQVEALLAGMSLEEKVGQVMMVGFDGTVFGEQLRAEIEELHLGGIVLFARNIASPQAVAHLVNDAQAAAQASGIPGLMVSIDQEGGWVSRLKELQGFTEFPSAMAVAATGDLENVRLVARTMAVEMAAVGINIDLAPVLDVNNNAANPVIGTRSFGSDPLAVARWGSAFIEAMQESGVMAVAKHFPGHGDTNVDSHFSLPTILHDRDRLEHVEFVPFLAARDVGAGGIMSAHITFPAIEPQPGLAATLSPRVLTGLLREEMDYTGLILTDSLEMGALASSGYPVPLAAAVALRAGADLLLMNRGTEIHREAFATVLDWVQRGEIPEARLDDAVRRVLAAKERYGILDPIPLDPNASGDRVGTAEHRALARQIALQSITLLRDDLGILPLPSPNHLLVVETPLAPGLGRALGAPALLMSLQLEPAEVQAILARATSANTIVVATVDVAANPAQAKLVQALLVTGKPILVVAMRSPYDLLAFPEAPAYVASYGASPPALEALAAVLAGNARPQGRLPVELPGLYAPGSGLGE